MFSSPLSLQLFVWKYTFLTCTSHSFNPILKVGPSFQLLEIFQNLTFIEFVLISHLCAVPTCDQLPFQVSKLLTNIKQQRKESLKLHVFGYCRAFVCPAQAFCPPDFSTECGWLKAHGLQLAPPLVSLLFCLQAFFQVKDDKAQAWKLGGS